MAIWAAWEGAKSLIWGQPVQPKHKVPTPEEVFKDKIFDFATMMCNQEECIKSCLKSVVDVLKPTDFDLSDASRETLVSHLENFNMIVDKEAGFSLLPEDVENLKKLFNSSLCEVAEKKWATIKAESFYSILSIDDEKKKIEVSEKWALQYFEEVRYFVKWEGSFKWASTRSDIQDLFVAKLLDKTCISFSDYSHKKNQELTEKIHARFEKDPVAFATVLENIDAKLQENIPLSSEEREFEESMNIGISALTCHWPKINNNLELLMKCVSRGYAYEEHNTLITGLKDLSAKIIMAREDNDMEPSKLLSDIKDRPHCKPDLGDIFKKV